jgi:hypothetical protein
VRLPDPRPKREGISLLGPLPASATSDGDGVPEAVTDATPNPGTPIAVVPKRSVERRSGVLRLKRTSTIR